MVRLMSRGSSLRVNLKYKGNNDLIFIPLSMSVKVLPVSH